jgi:hypothetical protein
LERWIRLYLHSKKVTDKNSELLLKEILDSR